MLVLSRALTFFKKMQIVFFRFFFHICFQSIQLLQLVNRNLYANLYILYDIIHDLLPIRIDWIYLTVLIVLVVVEGNNLFWLCNQYHCDWWMFKHSANQTIENVKLYFKEFQSIVKSTWNFWSTTTLNINWHIFVCNAQFEIINISFEFHLNCINVM